MFLFTLQQDVPENEFERLLEACSFVNSIFKVPVVAIALRKKNFLDKPGTKTALIHYNKPGELFMLATFFGGMVEKKNAISGHSR